jgi:hypothetical protein
VTGSLEYGNEYYSIKQEEFDQLSKYMLLKKGNSLCLEFLGTGSTEEVLVHLCPVMIQVRAF